MNRFIVTFYLAIFLSCLSCNVKQTSSVYEQSMLEFYDLKKDVFSTGNVKSFGKMFTLSIKYDFDLFKTAKFMSDKYNYPFANYLLFECFTAKSNEEYYYIDHLSYIEKCCALNYLNRAYLGGELNAKQVIEHYVNHNKIFFLKAEDSFEINKEYHPSMDISTFRPVGVSSTNKGGKGSEKVYGK